MSRKLNVKPLPPVETGVHWAEYDRKRKLKQITLLGTMFFIFILGFTTACAPAGNTEIENPAPDPTVSENSTKRPPDFPDYRDDLGWNTTKEQETGENRYRDNPSPNSGKDAWLHGINKEGKRIGDGVYDANQHRTLKDMNSDGILDGNHRGYNQTPLLDDKRLNWFD